MNIEDIPAELRWEIATKSSTMASIAQMHAFQEIAGEEAANQIESMVMSEGGKQAGELAAKLGLPSEDAIQTSEAWEIVGKIIMGPEIECNVVEADPERIVERITGCPMLNAHKELGLTLEGLSEHC